MITAAIDLTAAIDSTTLVTTADTEHFWARVHIVPADTGEWELLSGSTIIDHVQVGVAGGDYYREVQSRAVGDNLILRRIASIAMGGSVEYRLK